MFAVLDKIGTCWGVFDNKETAKEVLDSLSYVPCVDHFGFFARQVNSLEELKKAMNDLAMNDLAMNDMGTTNVSDNGKRGLIGGEKLLFLILKKKAQEDIGSTLFG